MKKILAIAASLALIAGTASAQSGLSSLLKGLSNAASSQTQQQDQTTSTTSSTANSILGGILNAVTSTVVTTNLAGNWTYNGIATAVGTDNALKDIAAQTAMTSVEKKLDANLAKIGIIAGAAQFQFLSDGTFTLLTEKMSYPGTWTQDGNNVTMKFGKVLGLLTMEGTVKTTTEGVDVVFQANKFLTFVKAVLDKFKVKNTNSTIASLAALMDQIQELKAGFKLVKA